MQYKRKGRRKMRSNSDGIFVKYIKYKIKSNLFDILFLNLRNFFYFFIKKSNINIFLFLFSLLFFIIKFTLSIGELYKIS